MNRFDLVPTRIANGRHLILRAVPVSRRDRVRRLARRLRLAPAAR